MTAPRNPSSEIALTRTDVAPDTAFVLFRPVGVFAMRGTFTSGPVYDEGEARWTAEASIEGREGSESRVVSLYDMGITPDGTGQRWTEAFTMDAFQQF